MLDKYDLEMDLPTLEHGEYFWESDSINYFNVFILNDSTIQLEDSVFNLDTTKVNEFLNYIYRPKFDFDCSKITKQIGDIANQTEQKNEINIFMKGSDTMEILSSFYHYLSNSHLPKNTYINLIGKGNLYVSLKHNNFRSHWHSFEIIDRNVLEILINKNNNIMIEGTWDCSLYSISEHIKYGIRGKMKIRHI